MGQKRGSANDDGQKPAKLRLRTICCSCGTEVVLAQPKDVHALRTFHTKQGRRQLIETDTACPECGANRVKRLVRDGG